MFDLWFAIILLYSILFLYRMNIDISFKKLKDLESEVEQTSNVHRLDASNNELTGFSELVNLKHLEELKLSHNRIEKLVNMQNMNTLLRLELKYNRIKDIQ